MFKQTEVLIAGAGPVGQFTALCLTRRGIETEIIDEEWRPAGHSYALALHPESLRRLESVGLSEAVLDAAYPIHSVGLYDRRGRRASFDFLSGESHPHLAVLRQDVFERILEEELEKQGVKVRWNHRLARFAQEQDHVEVDVDKLVKDSVGYAVSHTEWMVGKEHHLEVPFVLAADGHRSLVRRQLEIDFEEVGPTRSFAVFEFDTDAELDGEMRMLLDDGLRNVLWPMPDGRCRWSLELEGASVSDTSRRKDRLVLQLGGASFPVLERDYLEELLRQRAPWFEGSIGEIHWRMVVRFERRLAQSFGRHRVWLLGDAGHMTGPVGIQSMNVGLTEGVQLADGVERVLRSGAAVEELESYGAGRLAEWRDLLGLTARLVPEGDTDPWIRQHADGLLDCLPAAGDDLARIARQLGLRFETAPLAVIREGGRSTQRVDT